ncbi:hypothetical protein Ae168Ps1_2474 [Pseudonocardia sp. Ae168_Ps1]|nr:hypothetical protein Ae150APs1_2468 [Pseudonocardia sp. Ae150A_Ps1]OLL80068.1 hypothetical protein Ae168Ps1_2474 [Pseudonocardia sp. Ae168_Ps1]OLL94169.1 hypothetical protein Ae356Ps1_4066 [Pseudonocardia sp. Ae356_Ps1]
MSTPSATVRIMADSAARICSAVYTPCMPGRLVLVPVRSPDPRTLTPSRERRRNP